jgi:D-3-phosphoglycerate dehydrogenase
MTPAKPQILIAEASRFSNRAAALLRGVAELKIGDFDRVELLQAVPGVNILWVRLRNHVDAEVLAAAADLKIIVSATTGLNHIDVAEAERRQIRILSLRGESDFLKQIRATGEHTVGLILALLRHLPSACNHVLRGDWNRDFFWGHELYGKTVGIVGFGRVGRIVADYLKSFEVRLLATDPDARPEVMPPDVTLVPLDELLPQSDIVSLHVNLTEKNQEFFGREQFARIKRGAWFVNTARGELIEESALLDALHSGRLSGAALDVLCDEQAPGMADHPLMAYARSNDNLIITPHIGGCTAESVDKTEVFLAEKLCQLLQHEKENA